MALLWQPSFQKAWHARSPVRSSTWYLEELNIIMRLLWVPIQQRRTRRYRVDRRVMRLCGPRGGAVSDSSVQTYGARTSCVAAHFSSMPFHHACARSSCAPLPPRPRPRGAARPPEPDNGQAAAATAEKVRRKVLAWGT
jgi:hypothetical protein